MHWVKEIASLEERRADRAEPEGSPRAEESGTAWIDLQPIGRRGQVPVGTTILDAARSLGVAIAAVCGGKGTCGRCKVTPVGQVSPPTETELSRLASEELFQGFRLACEARIRGDARVIVSPESLTAQQRVQVEALSDDLTVAPPIAIHDLHVPRASLEDLRSDWLRVCQALETGSGTCGSRDGDSETASSAPSPRSPSSIPRPPTPDWTVLRELPSALRENDWTLRVCRRQQEIVSLLPTGSSPLGVAIDVGTTTLAAYLADLETGRTLATAGVPNPQIAYGEDVMSRIGYAVRGSDESTQLQRVLVETLSHMVADLTSQVSASTSRVVEYVVVGNTAMHHLFLGLPVRQLGLAPYVAAINEALDVKARDLGLPSSGGAYVHLLPNVAGFVGADHVAMLLATESLWSNHTAIALDIGTNTEITLIHEGRKLCCSCASGPAFEGAHLRDGMRAAPGAIERARFSGGKLQVQTVGNVPAVGICGSGVVDAIAQLRLAGHLDARGRFRDEELPRFGADGRAYVLVPATASGNGRDIALTQRDVNEIQLAKSAIRSGIERLLWQADARPEQIELLVIAGAFGAYIDIESAMVIGMFPSISLSNCHQVGNAAGAGARQALLSTERREAAKRLASQIEYVELSGDARFAQLFVEHLKLSS